MALDQRDRPAAEPEAAVLSVVCLDAWIGAQQILHGVSFEVPAGGVTALLGRNGVGKTTTIRALLGLVRRAGVVRLAGERIDTEPTHRIVRRGIGYVPENREVFGSLSVAENLELARRGERGRTGSSHDQLVDELFPDLLARRSQAAGTLSGGQQQMLSLARALLNDNVALLVDEPTKGLAPQVVDEVADALQAAARRVPILLVEQDLSVVSRLADRVVVMAEGRIAHTDDTQRFLADPAAVRALLGVSGSGSAQAGQAP
ncbi:MAG TPA: ABC transporter ATP-binding protein [Jatrophihabitans sp.]|jgi:branched-chain amino acid transport system ATP-binding protein|uniref:ABC transporter ATP-binding protein n=1 Tax=Jatrophihabitans sp. TaxID=1932789 RepID=UPI002F17564D